MAKKRKKARVPKRILGVKIPKSLRRAAKPLAQFLGTKLGREVAAEAIVALAIGLAASDKMRAAFKEAGAHARKSGRGLNDVVFSLGRAAVLPVIAAVYESLPHEKLQQAQASAREGDGAVH